MPGLSVRGCRRRVLEQPGSQQGLLPFARRDQIGKVSFLSASEPPGRAGEDGKGVPSTDEKVEEWGSPGKERGLNSIEDKKDKGG